MRKFILTAILLLLSTLSAQAHVTELSLEKDQSNNIIRINGKAKPGESVGFQILPRDISITEFAQMNSKNDIVTFVYEEAADENGEFLVNALIKNSGEYTLYAASENESIPYISKEFAFFTADKYAQTISLLNASANELGFVNTAEENKAVLGFDEGINNTVELAKTLKFMYKELNGKQLDASDYVGNVYLYRNSFAALALREKKLDEIYPNIRNIVENDSTLKQYWDQYITGRERKKFLVSRISGKTIDSIGQLTSAIKEGLILTATRYPNGYMSLKSLYSDYKDVLGLSYVSEQNSVYNTLGSQDFADISALKLAYDSAVAASANSGNSGGGGGGGSAAPTGGGSKVSSKGSISSVVTVPQSPSVDSIDLGFLDLATYEWAYPSISRLFKEGIINGIADDRFAPSRQVKREEFVKMIACAMKLGASGGNTFIDVAFDAWYAPYVYAAYDNGIINGISQNEFGVSMDISRQDMACMIYNAIRSKGYEALETEILFTDKDSISDYAAEAVAQLVRLGIINGMDDNSFAPKENATRAQAAVIIDRALEYLR